MISPLFLDNSLHLQNPFSLLIVTMYPLNSFIFIKLKEKRRIFLEKKVTIEIFEILCLYYLVLKNKIC